MERRVSGRRSEMCMIELVGVSIFRENSGRLEEVETMLLEITVSTD